MAPTRIDERGRRHEEQEDEGRDAKGDPEGAEGLGLAASGRGGARLDEVDAVDGEEETQTVRTSVMTEPKPTRATR